jgi:hypothetical protein
VENEGPQMLSQYGAYVLRAGLARLYACMHTHTDQYVILIAFPQQQWFQERTPMLSYTYTACLVTFRSKPLITFSCPNICKIPNMNVIYL